MAEVNTGGGTAKKGKPKKMTLRVDFTPMVDMNMLLITFFMLCTTLAKPQSMDLTMPTNDKNLKESEKTKVKESKAITLILGEKNEVYYYLGLPKNASLKVTNYNGVNDKNSIRSLLLSRNRVGVAQMHKLKVLKYKGQITDDAYKKAVHDIKNSKDGETVIIEPMDKSTYKNLVDALDEMGICGIGKYSINDVSKWDKSLVDNLKQSGAPLTKASQIAK